MTKRLIEETLQLLADLRAAQTLVDDPVVYQQYENDIQRVRNLLDRLNEQLNRLTDKDK